MANKKPLTIQDLGKEMLRMAKINLKRDGRLQPVVALIKNLGTEPEVTFVGFAGVEHETKDLMTLAIRELVELHDADTVILIAEAWMTVSQVEEIGKVRPSQHPDRIEVINIQGVNRDKEKVYFTQAFKHVGKKIVFTEFHDGSRHVMGLRFLDGLFETKH